MSTDSAAQREKNEGSQAWSRGEYNKAIEHFSNAITSGGDKEFLKVLYSNRSAAYLKVNKINEALSDGNKCIELDNAWPKGYSRKGDALYSQKKYTDAYNVYNTGLRASPSDSTLKEKAEQAMKAIGAEADRQQQWNSSSSNSGFGSSSSTSSTSTATVAPAGGIARYIELSIFVLAVLYLLPIGRFINSWSYKLLAGIFAGLHIQSLYQRYGFPKLNMDYAQRIIPDPATMRAFIGVYLTIAPSQYIFAILPLVLVQLTKFTPEIFAYGRNNAALIENSITPTILRYVPQLANLRVAQLFASHNLNPINTQIFKMAATVEVYQGIFHIFELILPSRNLIGLYLWWQYLRMRYMLDSTGQMKAAFYELDMKITQLLYSQYCPQILRQVYTTVKGYLAKQVEMPTAESAANASAGSGSFLSKCTIM